MANFLPVIFTNKISPVGATVVFSDRNLQGVSATAYQWNLGNYFQDPYWSSVVTVLHWNGTAAASASSASDTGPYQFPIVQTGSVSLSPAAQYGATALQSGSTAGNLVSIGGNVPVWYISGSQDFTVEFWIKGVPAADSIERAVMGDRIASGSGFWVTGYLTTDNHSFITMRYGTNGGIDWLTYTQQDGALWNGSYHHVAFVRKGTGANNITTYYDGSSTGATAASSNAALEASMPLLFGNVSGSSFATNPYLTIDEVRITRAARYSGSFTPTGPFPSYQ